MILKCFGCPMNRLYKEVSEEFLGGLREYVDGKIGYEEIERLCDRESLAYSRERWESVIEEGANEILEIKRRIYEGILKIEEKVRMLERMGNGREFEADVEAVAMHSEIVGRNAVPPVGYENAGVYLPPFPSISMVRSLNSDDAA
ncbi:hypothetical protein HK407_06g10790 [Ordospora pajunii]|uniref:uncharacterized protein n=1 Tax=Ordospora pajunii TaxID=3039483 RepID=UPI00295288E4|nr:uncharacterized protein HK407_06g10790 [Ordospora pajunii]KAH9411249.1 hypothetical protein HK407_06g10790 [Ordospora pajunii]